MFAVKPLRRTPMERLAANVKESAQTWLKNARDVKTRWLAHCDERIPPSAQDWKTSMVPGLIQMPSLIEAFVEGLKNTDGPLRPMYDKLDEMFSAVETFFATWRAHQDYALLDIDEIRNVYEFMALAAECFPVLLTVMTDCDKSLPRRFTRDFLKRSTVRGALDVVVDDIERFKREDRLRIARLEAIEARKDQQDKRRKALDKARQAEEDARLALKLARRALRLAEEKDRDADRDAETRSAKRSRFTRE